MEKERFDEMKENLARLADEGVLRSGDVSGVTRLSGTTGAVEEAGAPVYLFAHCGATMELADELLKMGIKPSAILDNNPDKYGLEYKGIPVCAPQVAVKGDDSGAFTDAVVGAGKSAEVTKMTETVDGEERQDALILIVSRFYEQMASQMRSLGFTGRIEKLTDYNTYTEYSLSPDTLIRKSERLKAGIERLKRIKSEYPGRFIVFCPFPALGDVYFCMSYLKAYMEENGHNSCLVCVVGNAQMQVAELFDYGEEVKLDILKLDQKSIDEAIQAVIYTDDPDCYIAHQDRPYVVDLHRALKVKCIPLETVYKCGVFGLPQDTEAARPVNWEEYRFPEIGEGAGGGEDSGCAGNAEDAERLSGADDTSVAKAAIISPYAKSVASLPESLWIDMVSDLISSGYKVYTNIVGDEKPLAGTKAISPSIAQMKSAVEQAGLFIGIRSGMCDVIKTTDCKKIALYPDYYYCDTKWKSIDIYAIEGFQNIVVKDNDTWEEVKKRIEL